MTRVDLCVWVGATKFRGLGGGQELLGNFTVSLLKSAVVVCWGRIFHNFKSCFPKVKLCDCSIANV